MSPRQHRVLLSIRASDIAHVHTILALAAFLTALALGSVLHFKKIVKNGVAGYPQEWFPSVSATIGDWYPERSIFHILIALNSGPRFALVFLQYYLQRSSATSLPFFVLLSGLVRTLSCGGWVYITSEDDHDAHDVLMIAYIICNIPWMYGGIACTPKKNVRQRRRRYALASIFFVSILPMMYFFVQHKVHSIAGAYTYYAFFEWCLIFTDVLFDSVVGLDFAESNLRITVDIGNQLASQNKHQNVRMEETSTASPLSREKAPPEDVPHIVSKSPSTDGSAFHKIAMGLYNSTLCFIQSHRVSVSFGADVFLAYVFWSIFTSLIPSLFYFSVWKLGIGGAELALLAILSPSLLGFKFLKEWTSSKPGRVTLHVLSFAGLVAFMFPSPTCRLILVSFANVFLCVGAVVDWSGLSGVSAGPQSILIGLGLILSSLSKHANHANNPVWPMLDTRSGGYNKTGLFLAVLSVLELVTRGPDDKKRLADVYRSGPAKGNIAHKSTVCTPSCWLPQALSFGSLIFSLHCFLTDSSTLIAWTWTGYPIKGPVPHIHGTFTLFAQSAGLLIPLVAPSATSLLASPFWFLFGAVCSVILYTYNDWLGYTGGLGLAIFLMSIIPQTSQLVSASTCVGRTYFAAFLVTVLLYLANVWTVAYAFVPGGEYLRERSDLVLLIQIALLAPAFEWPIFRSNRSYPNLEFPFHFRMHSSCALAFMAAAMGLVSLYRTPINAPRPFKPGPRIIRAGIWTVHFGMDNEGRDSQRAMRDLIQDMELDVVGLLETDLHRHVYGNRDLTRVLIEEIGYYVDLGPGPNHHTWGAVLLSKHPIINSTHHLLPSPRGELAPAISAFLDVWGTEVMVVVAHNGQEEDPVDRELQSTELARIINSTYPAPAIFLGYVVTKPHAPRPSPYNIMVEDGQIHDIDAFDLDRWCEYIFYRGLYRTSYLRMSRGKITDTELQVGQFIVPRFGHNVKDESERERYLRVHKETLDEQHWFPMEYYGNEKQGGKNGHFYHVFNTPLYYNIPDNAVL
ncbi:Frag1/DRAM/Sfk1 family-domain-containing protein [Phellopilus nigrolimitatus]|nr:Frag1/DRAM/Sfk1 family-domain-containing protein [Phellopilus nigrolimitatus]